MSRRTVRPTPARVARLLELERQREAQLTRELEDTRQRIATLEDTQRKLAAEGQS